MWRDYAAERIIEAMEEAVGGAPKSVWCLRPLCRRFGVRLRGVPRAAAAAPFLRANVIYIPRRRLDPDQCVRWLIHELAHAAIRYDGVTPLICPAEAPDSHAIARLVEERVMRRHFGQSAVGSRQSGRGRRRSESAG